MNRYRRPVIIDPQFCGPPVSGNGGYTCGLLAGHLGLGSAEVTLRKPPPLGVEMEIRDGGLYSGPDLVASAVPAVVADEPPPWTGQRAEYPGHAHHPFPTCYVCGPGNEHGLHIYPGRIAEGRTAASWRVPGDVTSATVWAALDCPGGWTIQLEEKPSVLGRMAARIDAVPPPGSECVITGALVSAEGRKSHVVTALYGPARELLAVARATWIALG